MKEKSHVLQLSFNVTSVILHAFLVRTDCKRCNKVSRFYLLLTAEFDSRTQPSTGRRVRDKQPTYQHTETKL